MVLQVGTPQINNLLSGTNLSQLDRLSESLTAVEEESVNSPINPVDVFSISNSSNGITEEGSEALEALKTGLQEIQDQEEQFIQMRIQALKDQMEIVGSLTIGNDVLKGLNLYLQDVNKQLISIDNHVSDVLDRRSFIDSIV